MAAGNFTRAQLDEYMCNKGFEPLETEQKEYCNYRQIEAFGAQNMLALSVAFQPFVFIEFVSPEAAFKAMLDSAISIEDQQQSIARQI